MKAVAMQQGEAYANKAWRTLSEVIGAEYIEGPGDFPTSRVEAKFGPWTVTLSPLSAPGSSRLMTNQPDWTTIRAPFVTRDGFRFHVYRTTLLTGLGKILGMQDITVGDRKFDDCFVVQATDPKQATAFFADAEIRSKLHAQPYVEFQILDNDGVFGQKLDKNVDILQFMMVGHVEDIDRLKEVFEIFKATLSRLVEIGSAHAIEPTGIVKLPLDSALVRPSSEPPGKLLKPATFVDPDTAHLLPRAADPPTTNGQ